MQYNINPRDLTRVTFISWGVPDRAAVLVESRKGFSRICELCIQFPIIDRPRYGLSIGWESSLNIGARMLKKLVKTLESRPADGTRIELI